MLIKHGHLRLQRRLWRNFPKILTLSKYFLDKSLLVYFRLSFSKIKLVIIFITKYEVSEVGFIHEHG
ncbi:hypothetical protein Hdeb2414_s0010g00344031 [Helianthus debilis subsp. tardiflorus]